MVSGKHQIEHYKEVIGEKRKSKFLFSCGYEERFDPFMFYKKPDVAKAFEKIFRHILKGKKYDHILDVGCGTGFYFPVLKKFSKKIVGFDFSPEMIDEAKLLIKEKKLLNIKAEVGDVEKLKYKDKSFDCVICFDVLHHIPNLKKGLKEINRVMKDDGIFIAIEPNMLNPVMFIAHSIPKEERGAVKRNYPLKLKRLLSTNFSRIKVNYINYIASSKNKIVLKIVDMINKNIDRRPYKYFSFRQIVYAKK